uniref:Ribosomal protein S19 n=1 Tax=Gloeochaete wittrockiana TaxID=38269 RepID=A0A096Y6Q3_9EUKA|nr:ribosomal protein S19 [Gloeochaete wittrockiana]AIM52010.1 ribosomal protein S19 [Gloeochaete wittrockiana]
MKTWSRSKIINENDINKTFEVYNGIKFIKIYITMPMMGFKLGEFSWSKKTPKHKKKINKKHSK